MTTSAPTNNFNPPGEGDIWRMSWNGTHKRNVTDDPTFEFRPAWARTP